MLQLERGDDPLILAQIDATGRLSEYTDVAVWVTWGSDLVVIVMWSWLVVLLVGGT